MDAALPPRIILDVDTGTDDAIALMVAALAPQIKLIGATTVSGNVAVDIATENTLRVLDHISADVPVFGGMGAPLVRPARSRETPSTIHGDYLDLPSATSAPQAPHAVDWLIETYLASDGDITLVPVGPLTNIAMAIRKEPRILHKIPQLVIMGGGDRVGNVTPSAEFNFWADPEAARIVIGCGRPIRLIPLDATHRALVSLDDCRRLRELGTPAGEAAATFITRRINGYSRYQPMAIPDAAPVHDALALCAIIDPQVVRTERVHVDVETRGELTDGRSVCDLQRRGSGEPNVELALDADADRFIAMLMEILGRSA